MEHLIIDPAMPFSLDALGTAARGAVDEAGADLIVERAIETAVAGGAQITTMATGDAQGLLDAGGMAALLRY